MAFSKTYTFSPSTTISSTEVNTNFDNCIDAVNNAVPSGLIMMWHGSVASIPSGYYLCNGSNSTPDLRGQFIIGAGGTYAVDATGGETTHTLSVSEIPSHSHLVRLNGYTTSGTDYNDVCMGGRTGQSYVYQGMSQSQGGDAAHNNLPPYYALAYVMKS